jgi:hypothetical protein
MSCGSEFDNGRRKNPKKVSVYAVSSVCSISALLYAGHTSLLQELRIIPNTMQAANIIASFFIVVKFSTKITIFL